MSTTPTKPNAGALRAARVLEGMSDAAHKGQRPQLIADEIAEVIDQESGLAELLEAAQRVTKWIDAGCDPSTKSLEALQRAIAKATNPNATVQQVAPLGRWTDKKGTV